MACTPNSKLQLTTLPRLLATPDVADYLGQKPRTIHDWIRKGELPGIKLGRRWFIVEEDLLAYIRSRSEALLAKVGMGVGRQKIKPR
jgi:excisionase family DNA binding protein